MEIELDMEVPGGVSLHNYVGDELEAAEARLYAGLAQEIASPPNTGLLNDRSRSDWPVDTARSIRAMQAESVDVSNDILITNSAPYAKHVNNDPFLANGAPNRNYRAVQRTLERWWDRIVERAIKGADLDVSQ